VFLGVVVRRFRDFAASEDAVQEALVAAAVQWPRDGVPENPRAWLIQVASRRRTDHVRSEVARRRRETAAAMESGFVTPAGEMENETDQDGTPIQLIMCCHPALTSSSAIALTLRAVGSHHGAADQPAKQSIKASGVPFRSLRRRTTAALRVARSHPADAGRSRFRKTPRSRDCWRSCC